jgi:hypothetical protein
LAVWSGADLVPPNVLASFIEKGIVKQIEPEDHPEEAQERAPE